MHRQIERLEHAVVPRHAVAYWYPLDGSDEASLAVSIPDVLSNAVPKRLGSFRAGRACSACALRQLVPSASHVQWPGYDAVRAPIWPDGICGSISHSDQAAIAILAPSDTLRGIGIDIELPIGFLEQDGLAAQIYQLDEGAVLAASKWAPQTFTVIFSAKEAIYKAIYPTVRRFVGFEEVTLIGYHTDKIKFLLNSKLAKQLGQSSLEVSVTMWRHHILTICHIV